jgi:osmotically-inducible protein OsmY
MRHPRVTWHPETNRRPFPRGPKGFKRSDERLKDDIAERLMYQNDIDVSDVSLDVKDSKVTLEGTVPERWMRFAIDDLAESVIGVESVENNVRVRRTSDSNEVRAQDRGASRR